MAVRLNIQLGCVGSMFRLQHRLVLSLTADYKWKKILCMYENAKWNFDLLCRTGDIFEEADMPGMLVQCRGPL